MMKKVSSVEEYIETHENYSEALTRLRDILIETELEETIKWSIPTYTINGKNVCGLGAFKNHFGIWFFNGVFLKDEHQVLRNAQDGKTKAMRQLIFYDISEINPNIVRQYVLEAIENQKAGLELKPDRKRKALIIPEELLKFLKEEQRLYDAFQDLAPYKQREYCDYISSAKREATKLTRLEKIIPMIKSGKGLHDKYKNC